MREYLEQEGLHPDDTSAIPHLFRCPISLDVFTDPVTLCTGQTYDRPSIERWLQLGNLTCPVTMQRLHDPSIVPNHTLRHLIQHWDSLGRRPVVIGGGDPDLLFPLVAVKHALESCGAAAAERLLAVQKVRALIPDKSPTASPACSHLNGMGFLPALLEVAFSEAERRKFSHGLVDEALSCAVKLLDAAAVAGAVERESAYRSLGVLRQDSKVASFHRLFEEGGPAVEASLCCLIEAICSSPETQEISTLLLTKKATFSHEVVGLLYRRERDEIVEAGLRAVRALCSVEPNREPMVRAGLVDGLIDHVRDGSSHGLLAIAALEKTLGVEKAREGILENPNGVGSLVRMVFRVSDLEGSERAVSCLIRLCEWSERAREAAVGAGVLTQLLLLLQSHCSGRTKAGARALLKVLRRSSSSKEGR
ncbi:hypothetical protein SAY86_002669 [Trapa natans]|uniref:U-box domain-containing protein n=1 Tax=Trapa natans TaxID=22666 RepID=A0AAN7LRD9_TRANT|nr:hypothetical protein SAY86_002669 [Trapa natans]